MASQELQANVDFVAQVLLSHRVRTELTSSLSLVGDPKAPLRKILVAPQEVESLTRQTVNFRVKDDPHPQETLYDVRKYAATWKRHGWEHIWLLGQVVGSAPLPLVMKINDFAHGHLQQDWQNASELLRLAPIIVAYEDRGVAWRHIPVNQESSLDRWVFCSSTSVDSKQSRNEICSC